MYSNRRPRRSSRFRVAAESSRDVAVIVVDGIRVFFHVVPAARSGELLDGEKDGECKPGNAGELFSALAERLVQECGQPEVELGEEERLHPDDDGREPE